MAGLSCHLGWCGALAPVDCIHGPAEVPPAGVGLRATRNPGHRDGIPDGGGCILGHIPPIPLSGGHVIYTWEGNPLSAGQTGWDCPPRTNSDREGNLDGVLRDHR